ncbi:MAG TPA: hypothetical protein PLI15_15360, partial [Anaerolineales bacterium]|nr:hypothetical protein [Anaerolineales bacterium]HNF34885.1 hypothetical protein [Anaerolineales bacterium]
RSRLAENNVDDLMAGIWLKTASLHLLIALNGAIPDFELAPANEYDLVVGFILRSEYTES